MIALSNALAPTASEKGLQVAIGPASLWLNGSVTFSPFTFIFLSPNSTSYVYLNTSTGQIGVNTTGYSSGNIPIATVVTSLLNVVTLVDTRPDFTNVGSSGTVYNFSDDETPGGVPNGALLAFTLAHTPSPAASLVLSRNGLTQFQGTNYSLSTNNITFAGGIANTPQSGDILAAWYRY
jgi:hypothetical protein